MSSNLRPWYQFWPKDFNQDEKVQCLTPLAELIYRRALDVLWQNNGTRIPFAIDLLYGSLGKGISKEDFEAAWARIQYPGFEILKISEDEKWIYSRRLQKQKLNLDEKIEMKKRAGKKGAKARWDKA